MTDFNELVKNNMKEITDYSLETLDFIDKVYHTTYNECNMNDEIERLTNELTYQSNFTEVERIYDLACEKYPLVKEQKLLNPRLRLVDLYHIFDKLFEKLEIKLTEDEYDTFKEQLFSCYPDCDVVLNNEMVDRKEDDDESWFVPLADVNRCHYKELYETINERLNQPLNEL